MPSLNPKMEPISPQTLSLPRKFNFKFAALGGVLALLNLGLGLALEKVFAGEFSLDLSLWGRFLPLVLLYLLVAGSALILAATLPFSWRQLSYAFSALGFGLAFLLPPHHLGLAAPFAFIFMLVYLVGLTSLDFSARQAIKTHAVFTEVMFRPAVGGLFMALTLVAGFLVYFSSTVPKDLQFKIPEGYLDPALDLIINQVVDQLQGELGTGNFTEEEFLAELKKSGLLTTLEEQFGIKLEESEVKNPQELVENIREPLAVELAGEIERILEDSLGPYLPYLPLAAAVGMVLSLLFLSPVFGYLALGFFALFYRILIKLEILELVSETREVPVLKLR